MKELRITDKSAKFEEICKDKDLDEIWDIISNSIISSAYATLPSQKVAVCRIPLKKINESDIILKDLRCLGKICHKCIEKKGFVISEEERQQTSLEIARLNSKYELQIDELVEKRWSDEIAIDLKNWWKTLNLRLQQERRKEEAYEINKHIDNHCETIQGELKPMLNSLLERSSKKIKVDRIMKVSGDEKILLTEEKEVLSEVRSHFMKQFRKETLTRMDFQQDG